MKARIKRMARRVILPVLHRSGADRLWARGAGAEGAMILMYHSVTDAENRPWIAPEGSISVEDFAAHMRFLARHRNPVSLSALLDMVEAGETPPQGMVAVTFDDGYLDTLRLAGPVLVAEGVPATVFVVSDWVGGTAPWVDRLHSAFAQRRADEVTIDGRTWRMENGAGEAFDAALPLMLDARPETREAMLEEIITALDPASLPPRLLMTWEEIAEWQALGPGFEVGVHTGRHPDLRLLSDAEIAADLDHCAAELRDRLGVERPHFAYPYGRADARTRAALAASPCRSALEGGVPRRVTAASDPFALSRSNAPGPVSRLGVITSGAWPDLPLALRLGAD